MYGGSSMFPFFALEDRFEFIAGNSGILFFPLFYDTPSLFA